MAALSQQARDRLKKNQFAGPDRSYPVNDASHASNAKARAKQQLDAGRITRAQYEQIVAAANRKLAAGG